jgi:CTP synthase (UTP-ammonia lyase)
VSTVEPLRIGLIGEHQPAAVAHRAIPVALARGASAIGVPVEARWLPTADLARDLAPALACDGLWAVPATPYVDGEAAIAVIRRARESGLPFLGTCGGYQHALLEYARNVLGLASAQHAEEHPDAVLALIGPLACELVEVTGRVRLLPGSRMGRICGTLDLEVGYHCRYGLEPKYRKQFEGGALRIVAEDPVGDARGFELDGHPFFFGTAFQPERAALAGHDHPLVLAFVRAAAEARTRRSSATR